MSEEAELPDSAIAVVYYVKSITFLAPFNPNTINLDTHLEAEV